jgi:hypothetical protein
VDLICCGSCWKAAVTRCLSSRVSSCIIGGRPYTRQEQQENDDLAWDHVNLAADIKHAHLQWSLRHAGPRRCTTEPCNQHHIEVIVRPLWTASADEYRSHAKQSRFPRPMDLEPSRSPEQRDRIDSRSFLEL